MYFDVLYLINFNINSQLKYICMVSEKLVLVRTQILLSLGLFDTVHAPMTETRRPQGTLSVYCLPFCILAFSHFSLFDYCLNRIEHFIIYTF